MAKVEDVMRKAKEAAKQANEKADPVVDSWLRRLVDDPRTPLWAAAILLSFALAVILFAWLTRGPW